MENEGVMTLASNDAKEALQGYPTGMSRGFRHDIPEEKRSKVIGNAWNYHQMCGVFRHFTLDEEQTQSFHTEVDELQGVSEREKQLLRMSDEEQLEHLMKKMEGYKLPELRVMLKDEQTTLYQVQRHQRMHTPAARKEVAMAEIKLRLRRPRGHVQLTTHKREQWIANMFCKGKKRINLETLLEAIRLLTDFRNLNSAITWPVQWKEECPTIEGVKMNIPRGAKWFASEDVSDAYESAVVHETSRHLLTAAPPYHCQRKTLQTRSWQHGESTQSRR
jgi:hypothetical protein